MEHDDLDDETREAVSACVGSVDELDVLIYLARHGGRYCSPPSVAADLGLSPHRVATALEVLASRNLLDVRITQVVLYRLDPPSPGHRRDLERTLTAARRCRAAVLQLVALAG